MAIPPEFSYADEADFTARFLIPLLSRLGFSVVVNYHGTREMGKDLIFGEVDRFGHVVYHGLQAKYVPSISVNTVDELIQDAKQALATPFHHPHKNSTERISTFYAVNGGSIADGARDLFFESLSQPYGGNVRLLDGKALIGLDRMIAQDRTEEMTGALNALLTEVKINRLKFGELKVTLQRIAELTPKYPVPVERFRLAAIEHYLVRPFPIPEAPIGDFYLYYEYVNHVNKFMDNLSESGRSVENRGSAAAKAIENFEKALPSGAVIETGCEELLNSLGPLVPL